MNLKKLNGTFAWQGIPRLWSSIAIEPNTYAWFSRSFEIELPVVSARIALTADRSYKLYVNGEFVLMGPMREEQPYFYYDALDISDLLKNGFNTISILSHAQRGTEGSDPSVNAGLALQGCIVLKNQTLDLSDYRSWLCTPSRARKAGAHKLGSSAGIGYSELFDFADDDTEYCLGKFTGAVPVVLQPLPQNVPPVSLERDLPFFSGKTFVASSIVRTGKGMLADFGQEVFGFVELRFTCAKDSSFSVSYAELLTHGEVDFRKAGMEYRDHMSAPGGEFVWKSYEKRAGRYVFIDDPEIGISSLRIHEYGYPYVRQPLAVTGDASGIRRKILDLSARTIEICSDDVLNDCPWRERSQYLDPYAYFGAMKKLFGTLEPAKKFLRQFARGAGKSVPMPMCYPSQKSTTVIPDFVMLYAFAIKNYLDLSGDSETAAECFKVSHATLEYFRDFQDKDGLLMNVPGWIFLDNSFEICKRGKSCGLNATYAGALAALADIAEAIGENGKAASLRSSYRKIRESFRKTFLRDGRLLDSNDSGTEGYKFWNYHFPGDTGSWNGKSFFLKTRVLFPDSGSEELRLSFFNGCRVWLDGKAIFECGEGGGWEKPALFNPHAVKLPGISNSHELVLEIGHSPIDWEVFVSSRDELSFDETYVTTLDAFGKYSPDDSRLSWTKSRLRPYFAPKLSQVSVALASLFGMLEHTEAASLLKSALPVRHYSNYKKRTTPYFVEITDVPEKLMNNVIPCNTPWSMNFLCQALRKHGMENEARRLVVEVFGKQIEMGATSWWEEWGTASSLCHAWAAFAAEYV